MLARLVFSVSAVRIAFGLAALALAAASLSAPAAAQGLRSVEARWDNDILSARVHRVPPDYDYSQGARLGLAFDGGLWRGVRTTALAFEHRIYTPRTNALAPVAGERPYAGWLGGTVAVTSPRPGGHVTWALTLGLVGPKAGGQRLQDAIHRGIGSGLKLGWEHQLGTEVAFAVGARRAWTSRAGPFAAEAAVEGTAGTLWTGVAGEVGVTIGRRSGPFAGVRLREEWVLRDLFLDGNTFRQSVRAAKTPLVFRGRFEAGWRIAQWSLGYRMHWSSRTYAAEGRPHNWGSLVLRWER